MIDIWLIRLMPVIQGLYGGAPVTRVTHTSGGNILIGAPALAPPQKTTPLANDNVAAAAAATTTAPATGTLLLTGFVGIAVIVTALHGPGLGELGGKP